MNRRDFLKICGSVLAVGGLAGCASNGGSSKMSSEYKREIYSGDLLSGGPFPHREQPEACKVNSYRPRTSRSASRNEVVLDEIRSKPHTYNNGKIQAYSRTKWNAKSIIPSRMKLMNGVERITVHHEGNPKPNFSIKAPDVEKEIYKIQKTHFRTLKAGDIAYHYIVDRAGRIWQGRDIKYQGAHSKNNNSHNIGIMCLGNFEIQKPTGAQVATLEQLCRGLMAGYGIPASKLYGHRELKSTACPGKNLFPYVKKIRAVCV